uniref:Protein kinase domain-containing protein n=1 Tax=Maylandia zebra TaxID=106582 RepID=A0A3P9B4X3_9CICH
MLALDLELVKGSILGKHYKVEAFLGEGGFGIVAKCRDTTTNQAVAIKVNKSSHVSTLKDHTESVSSMASSTLDKSDKNTNWGWKMTLTANYNAKIN